MKRSLSSTFVPLDLRAIIECVAHDVIEYDFKNNSITKDEDYSISIYSDPTLPDGQCQYVEDDEESKVFMCSNQFDMFSQIPNHVLETRLKQLGPVQFNFNKATARCSFTHDSTMCSDGHIFWTIRIATWDFDHKCYFGSDMGVCPFVQNLPKDRLKWEGEKGKCKSTLCKDEDCEQRIFCMTHDGGHEEIHKL